MLYSWLQSQGIVYENTLISDTNRTFRGPQDHCFTWFDNSLERLTELAKNLYTLGYDLLQ